jgi:hypothetical protein
MGQCKNISAESTILDDIWNFFGHFSKNISGHFSKNISGHFSKNISGHFSKNISGHFSKNISGHLSKNLVTLSTSMDDEFKTSGTDPLGWTNSLQSDAGAMSSWGRFDETISDVIQ